LWGIVKRATFRPGLCAAACAAFVPPFLGVFTQDGARRYRQDMKHKPRVCKMLQDEIETAQDGAKWGFFD
jgi:hypothetical protein